MNEPLGYEITKVGRYTYEARAYNDVRGGYKPMNDVEAVAGAMLRLQDTLNPMTDMMVGYRRRLLEAGFSEGAAESMTIMLFSWLLTSIGGRMG